MAGTESHRFRYNRWLAFKTSSFAAQESKLSCRLCIVKYYTEYLIFLTERGALETVSACMVKGDRGDKNIQVQG